MFKNTDSGPECHETWTFIITHSLAKRHFAKASLDRWRKASLWASRSPALTQMSEVENEEGYTTCHQVFLGQAWVLSSIPCDYTLKNLHRLSGRNSTDLWRSRVKTCTEDRELDWQKHESRV
jgi:hypothetical protein